MPAYVAWMDEQYAEFYEQMAQEQYDKEYDRWASDQREDGEDDSREAYDTYLEGFFPED